MYVSGIMIVDQSSELLHLEHKNILWYVILIFNIPAFWDLLSASH